MSGIELKIFAQSKCIGEIVRAGRKVFAIVDAQRIGRESDKDKFNRAALNTFENVPSRLETLAQILIRSGEVDALNVGNIFKVQSVFCEAVARRETVNLIFFGITQIRQPCWINLLHKFKVDDIVFGHVICRQKFLQLGRRIFIGAFAANQP